MYTGQSPSQTRLYAIWANMKQRCFNPKAHEFNAYGGRGITVCAEWLHDFKAFEDWAYSRGGLLLLALNSFQIPLRSYLWFFTLRAFSTWPVLFPPDIIIIAHLISECMMGICTNY